MHKNHPVVCVQGPIVIFIAHNSGNFVCAVLKIYLPVFLIMKLCAPLSCFRKLDALRYTSGLSVLFVVFLMLMVLGFSLPPALRDPLGLHPCEGEEGTCVGDKPMIRVTTTTFQVFGIITNAYSCQSVS